MIHASIEHHDNALSKHRCYAKPWVLCSPYSMQCPYNAITGAIDPAHYAFLISLLTLITYFISPITLFISSNATS